MALLSSIAAYLSAAGCRKFLASDGITSPNFELLPLVGVFEGKSIDARAARKSLPALGETFSIAKNLDEYQRMICLFIPSLVDRDPVKAQLQKYRIGIIAAFARLASFIEDGNILEWNRHAKMILEEASNSYVAAKSRQRQYIANIAESFLYFNVPEDEVDVLLANMYA